MQDLLIQQRQISDVSKLVEKDASIRSLNMELAKKTEQISDLKSRLQQLMAAKGNMQPGREFDGSNKELVDHLSGVLTGKETEVEHQQKQIADVLRREEELKAKLAKLEFLYDLDPNKPLIKYGQGSANQNVSGQPGGLAAKLLAGAGDHGLGSLFAGGVGNLGSAGLNPYTAGPSRQAAAQGF